MPAAATSFPTSLAQAYSEVFSLVTTAGQQTINLIEFMSKELTYYAQSTMGWHYLNTSEIISLGDASLEQNSPHLQGPEESAKIYVRVENKSAMFGAANVVEHYSHGIVKTWKDEIDSLVVYAGLFLAVLVGHLAGGS
ncbi:hypothetical protein BD309DRAFT_984754 [Dichomitus squalens]|nr:hypothetical protein BD309DRAFT_984754 [Dichomitus squalens]